MKKTNFIPVIAGLFALFLFSGISAQEFCSGYGGMMNGSYGYGFMFIGWIFGLLVVAALVLLIIWLVKQIKK